MNFVEYVLILDVWLYSAMFRSGFIGMLLEENVVYMRREIYMFAQPPPPPPPHKNVTLCVERHRGGIGWRVICEYVLYICCAFLDHQEDDALGDVI